MKNKKLTKPYFKSEPNPDGTHTLVVPKSYLESENTFSDLIRSILEKNKKAKETH